jgi:hypothetical protein
MIPFFGRNILIADHCGQPIPSFADPKYTVPLAEGPEGNSADCRIQTGAIPTSGQDANYPFFLFTIGHGHAPLVVVYVAIAWKIEGNIAQMIRNLAWLMQLNPSQA